MSALGIAGAFLAVVAVVALLEVLKEITGYDTLQELAEKLL